MCGNHTVDYILNTLASLYPDARCALHFGNRIELLVAVILSAQCTDKRVNLVMDELNAAYTTARDYADAPLDTLESIIKPCGLYRAKARNVKETCRIIADEHDGIVPSDMDALLRLPGVGRKVANCIRAEAFGIPSIVTDTHVIRLSQRMGLSHNTTPYAIERDLLALIPSAEQNAFCHRMIAHGRAVCTAQKPRCASCPFHSTHSIEDP